MTGLSLVIIFSLVCSAHEYRNRKQHHVETQRTRSLLSLAKAIDITILIKEVADSTFFKRNVTQRQCRIIQCIACYFTNR